MELLLGQFLVLGFTLVAWWLARRDLSARAAQAQAPATAEWERLRETVETLIAELERRAGAAEQRMAAVEQRVNRVEARSITPPAMPTAPPSGGWGVATGPALPEASTAAAAPLTQAQKAAHEERYAPVYALVDSGVTDEAEIARQTGLGQGEVNLILGLRRRRTL